MSLHALATSMASKGRNGDSMLVHMTPGEVHGLQALAMKHGGSLTTNPDTGLPEANFLKSILPILAGFALGPAGMGIAFGGLSSAASAGLLVGGVTGLATGSLEKGLMAGLGAYGGAGLGAGLETAAVQGELASNMPTLAGQAPEQVKAYSDQVIAARDAAMNKVGGMSGIDKLSAGFDAAKAAPGAFLKDNLMPLGMAAAPIMADMMVPTTTKASSPMAPGRIREKRWDGRQFVDVASTDAGVYNTSGRNFSDLYRGYNGGGIVALAGGGVPGYAGNAGSVVNAPLDTKNEIYQYFAKPETQALLAAGNDAAVAQALQDRNYSLADVAKATGTQNQLADYERRFTTAVNTPTTSAQEFQAMTSDVGLTGQALANALSGSGMSAAGQYAATHGLADTAGILDASGKPVGLYNTIGYTAGALPGDQGGLSGLYANINYSAKGLQDKIYSGALTVEEAQRLANNEMTRIGLSKADVKAATGKDLDKLFLPRQDATQRTTTTVTTPTDIATAASTALPVGVGGNTGPSQIGGGATVNPNGTITTSPRIPGIPVGGFTGMTGVRKAYTDGGGDLGYTSPVPTSLDAFNKTYVTDRMSDDSLAAYEYLTGKKGAKYPTKSGFAGQLSQDYATAVLGYPARGNLPYIYNKATGKMDPNPDYVAPGRNAAGDVTYTMSLNDIKKSLADTPMSGQALYDWAMSNNLSAQQIADATGRSLSSVYSDFRAGSKAAAKKKEDDKAAGINTLVDNSGAGSSDSGGGPGGTGPGGVGGAGGPGSTTASESIGPAADSGDNDAKGGYYSRGKLNYRAKNMAMGGTARDGVQQINAGTDTVSQAINTATSALGGVSGGGGGGGSFGFDGLFGSGGSSSSSGGGGISLLNGNFGGQNTTTYNGFGGRPPPTFSSTNTDTTRVPGTDVSGVFYPQVSPFPNSGPLDNPNMPIIDYSPFSEEGRRKRAEQVELGRAGGVTATGPMYHDILDYATANGLDDSDMGRIIDYSPFSEEGRRYKNYQNIDSQIQQLPSVTAYNDYTKSIGGRQPTANEISQVEQLRKGIVGDPGFTNLVSQGGNMGVASPYNRTNMLGMPRFDYGSSVNTTTTEDMMGGRRGPAIPFGQAISQLGIPAGLDDSDMGRIGMLSAQRNAAERASYANRNPASMSDLARQLGLPSGGNYPTGAISNGPLNTGSTYATGGMTGYALGGLGTLGGYSDGGRLLKGPGDGVSDSIPATIGRNQQPARLADGEFVIPARIVSELGNGSTDAGAKKLYAMMDRVQRARGKTTGKNKVAANSRSDKYLPA